MYKKLVTAVLVAFLFTAASVSAANKAPKQITGVVNINTATAVELQLLPGVGKSKADAIISYRQAAPFKSVQELTKVKGIGEKMLKKMQQYIAVEGPTTAKVVKLQTAKAALLPAL